MESNIYFTVKFSVEFVLWNFPSHVGLLTNRLTGSYVDVNAVQLPTISGASETFSNSRSYL